MASNSNTQRIRYADVARSAVAIVPRLLVTWFLLLPIPIGAGLLGERVFQCTSLVLLASPVWLMAAPAAAAGIYGLSFFEHCVSVLRAVGPLRVVVSTMWIAVLLNYPWLLLTERDGVVNVAAFALIGAFVFLAQAVLGGAMDVANKVVA